MTDPPIEEVREVIDRKIKAWSAKGPDSEIAEWVIHALEQIKSAAAPKPNKPWKIIRRAIHETGEGKALHAYSDAILSALSEEGYSIVHESEAS